MRKQEAHPIDIVIPWVDGSDPEWLAEKSRYAPDAGADDEISRYRDWNTLQYIFRGIEQFAPWVNNIFFVTWGHLPSWLNTNHPKLRIINHRDYIPTKYLPTFNSHTIELNFHRIRDLSEHFVYFNDDTFLIRETKSEDFFKKGNPCDSAILTSNAHNEREPYGFWKYRTTAMLNKHFNLREVLKSNPYGWFNIRYGKKVLLNIFFSHLFWGEFNGIMQHHLPTSLCKSTMEEVWGKECEKLDETCSHRFRTLTDFNQWIFRNWQLATGHFYPRNFDVGKNFILVSDNSLKNVLDYIDNQKGKMICINDYKMTFDKFNEYRVAITKSFERIFPEKSEYEK